MEVLAEGRLVGAGIVDSRLVAEVVAMAVDKWCWAVAVLVLFQGYMKPGSGMVATVAAVVDIARDPVQVPDYRIVYMVVGALADNRPHNAIAVDHRRLMELHYRCSSSRQLDRLVRRIGC
jgi:hypothetical protein